MDCIFCKIADGTIPSKKVYEDEQIIAFHDIQPQTPVHIVIIPKQHIESMNGITVDNSHVIAHIFEVIPQIAKEKNLANGYRVVSNCGKDGSQTVFHLHFHLMGGKQLNGKMG